MQIKHLATIATSILLLPLTSFTVAGARDVRDEISTNSDRDAFYGDLHLHTSYSFDAYLIFGANLDLDSVYRFARGEQVSYLGEDVRRATPALDFLAVTDHAENMGVLKSLEDSNSTFSKSDIGKSIRAEGVKAFAKIAALIAGGKSLPDTDVAQATGSAWQSQIDAANRNYQPGKFTTFIAYEWTSMPSLRNLHRNVIFRGNRAPRPFTAIDSTRPEDLWDYLQRIRKQGYEALAIPHNSNASNGLMFDWMGSDGRPIDQTYAEQRAANEPLVEIAQAKGQSETHPSLSPSDEFANFEIYDHYVSSTQLITQRAGGYVRDALGRGLVLAQQTGGVNPFKYGFVGGSDFHNGLTDSAEEAYAGTFGAVDPTKKLPDLEIFTEHLNQIPSESGGSRRGVNIYELGSGNLTGIWAEQNTRESLYAGLRRRETFATSGPRLKFRFFGGWEYRTTLLSQKSWVKAAYAAGVPMGGDLPAQPAGAKAPRFAIWAMKDPNSANLDRLQVIKVWLESGKHVEKIYDVALSGSRTVDPQTSKTPQVGNTVDTAKGSYANTIGATELSTVWEDPEFDPNAPAAYYLRVLEIPTPRWSTIASVKRGLPLPEGVSTLIQERGWSSPIWFTPRKM